MLEVFAETSPFAYVGLLAARVERDRIDPAAPLVIRAWPLELVNGETLDAGRVAHHIEQLRADIAPGLFVGFHASLVPATTLPALALVGAAYRVNAALGECVSFEVRRDLFEGGLDITDPMVLSDLAVRHGLDPRAIDDTRGVRDEWRDGRRRGVRGSPHFFCGDRDVFCPTLDFTPTGDGERHVVRNIGTLRRFLTDCFGASGGGPNADSAVVR